MAQPQCPSVPDILKVKSLLKLPAGEFQTAWKESFVDPSHCLEQGGFIYASLPLKTPLTKVFVVRAPKGKSMNQRTDGPNASIDLNFPGSSEKNVVLVANFHTHPLSSEVGGDPEPSGADKRNAYDRGLPGIVISRHGIYYYGPERRAAIGDNPKGYPPGVEQPGLQRATLIRLDPLIPQVVKDQYPEGTGRTLVQETNTVGETEEEEGGVIYAGWSNEGVVYGKLLVDSYCERTTASEKEDKNI